MSQITKSDALKAAADVMHPAIDRSLIDLGIVKDIEVEEGDSTVTFAFPFPNIPIAEQLISSVQVPLEALGLQVESVVTTMNQEEVQAFLAMEQAAWKGLS